MWCIHAFKSSNTFFRFCLPNLCTFYIFGYFEQSLFRTKSLVLCLFEIMDVHCSNRVQPSIDKRIDK